VYISPRTGPNQVVPPQTPYTLPSQYAPSYSPADWDNSRSSSSRKADHGTQLSVQQSSSLQDPRAHNARGFGWEREESSDLGEPSHTKSKSHEPYPPTDTTRPPQYHVPYSHSSRLQGSLASQPLKITWVGDPSRHRVLAAEIQPQTHLLAQRGQIFMMVSQQALYQDGTHIYPVCLFCISALKLLTQSVEDPMFARPRNPGSLTIFSSFLLAAL